MQISLGKPYHYSHYSYLDASWDVLLGGYSVCQNQILDRGTPHHSSNYPLVCGGYGWSLDPSSTRGQGLVLLLLAVQGVLWMWQCGQGVLTPLWVFSSEVDARRLPLHPLLPRGEQSLHWWCLAGTCVGCGGKISWDREIWSGPQRPQGGCLGQPRLRCRIHRTSTRRYPIQRTRRAWPGW